LSALLRLAAGFVAQRLVETDASPRGRGIALMEMEKALPIEGQGKAFCYSQYFFASMPLSRPHN